MKNKKSVWVFLYWLQYLRIWLSTAPKTTIVQNWQKSSPGQEFRLLLGRCLTNGCVATDPFQWLLSNSEQFLSWFLKTVENMVNNLALRKIL